MKHYLGMASENEFEQFKKLSGLTNPDSLSFDNNKVYVNVIDTWTLVTLAQLRGKLNGFLIAWRHCERLLQEILDVACDLQFQRRGGTEEVRGDLNDQGTP